MKLCLLFFVAVVGMQMPSEGYAKSLGSISRFPTDYSMVVNSVVKRDDDDDSSSEELDMSGLLELDEDDREKIKEFLRTYDLDADEDVKNYMEKNPDVIAEVDFKIDNDDEIAEEDKQLIRNFTILMLAGIAADDSDEMVERALDSRKKKASVFVE